MQVPRFALAVVLLAVTGCASASNPTVSSSRSVVSAASSAGRVSPSSSAIASRESPTPTPPPGNSPSAASAPSSYAPSVVPSGLWSSALEAAPVVPWEDSDYRSPVDPRPSSHPAGTPQWCSTADVTLGRGGDGDAGGTFRFFSWPLLARPGHRCSLQGTPIVRESGPGWTRTSDVVDSFEVSPGGVLDARHRGEVDFRWGLGPDGDEAELPLGPRTLAVVLPHGGGTLTASDTSQGWATAQIRGRPAHLGSIRVTPLWTSGVPVYGGVYSGGLAGGPWGAPAGSYGGRPDPDTLTAAPGQPLIYHVQVTGPSVLPATGPSCFGYREQLLDPPTGKVLATETHELNCSGLHALPPYGRLFAMQIRVPPSLGPGAKVSLAWQSDVQETPGWATVVVTAS